jgi:hypothetical protein
MEVVLYKMIYFSGIKKIWDMRLLPKSLHLSMVAIFHLYSRMDSNTQAVVTKI